MTKIVVFGVSDAAELALYYFENDSDHQVVAFTVDKEYVPEDGFFCGLPVLDFESIESHYPPSKFSMFVALGYSNVNKLRRAKYTSAKEKGYDLVSYVSSMATVLNNEAIGENCFILEDNTIQPFVTICHNVTMWSGNHIGHHSTIEDHCFLASQIVVSGRVNIGKCCFIGVNATLRDQITIGESSVIGAGALVLSSVEPNGLYIGTETERAPISSRKLKKI